MFLDQSPNMVISQPWILDSARVERVKDPNYWGFCFPFFVLKWPHYSCLITGYFIAFWCFHLISVCFNAHTFHGNSGNSPWNHCKKKRFSPAPVHRWLTSAGRLPVPRPPRPRVGGQDSMATNHCGCETAAVVCCFLLWLLLLLLCFFLWTWRNNA